MTEPSQSLIPSPDAAPPVEETLRFPSVIALDMGFNAQEDRVIMIARTIAGGRRVIFVTRRMMAQLLGHSAELMTRPSPAAARAPSAQRNEVLQMEHVGALTTPPASPPPAAASNPEAGLPASDQPLESAHLVTEIRMQVTESQLMIGFMGQRRNAAGADEQLIDTIAAATMDRAEAHRFLAMLNDRARDAEWGLEGLCPWLSGEGLAPTAQLQVN